MKRSTMIKIKMLIRSRLGNRKWGSERHSFPDGGLTKSKVGFKQVNSRILLRLIEKYMRRTGKRV
jgi:hypothetical protein